MRLLVNANRRRNWVGAFRYLKFLDFDPVAAARRIVDYWSIRAQLFGPRAFLPLQLSGEGALSKEDLEVLKTGSFVLLPRTAKNTPVLLYDPARLTTVAVTDTAKRLRCLFYFLSTVSETDAALVSLSVYNIRTRMATFDPVFLSKSVSYFGVRQVIPVRIVEAHMIMIATGLGSVIPLTVREMERLDQSNPCKVVVYDQKPMEEIQAEMKTHGFTLEGLPRVPFGGLHCFGEFRRWIEDRIRKEGQVYYDSNPPPLEDPVEVAARRKRQIEAASARRKRARKKIQTSVLRSEVDRLTRQRDELCRKEAELQKKIEEARLVVRVFGNLREGDAAASPTASDRSHLRFLGSSELALAISTEGRSDPFCESLLAGMVAAASIVRSEGPQAGADFLPGARCPSQLATSFLPFYLSRSRTILNAMAARAVQGSGPSMPTHRLSTSLR
jgi:hypothetical protein